MMPLLAWPSFATVLRRVVTGFSADAVLLLRCSGQGGRIVNLRRAFHPAGRVACGLFFVAVLIGPHPTSVMDIALERLAILRRLERWLEIPLFVLGLAWLALLIMELTVGITPTLEFAGTLIWGVFIVDFALRLAIAPDRSGYLRKNVLTIVALLIPAMRVFRLARMVRVLRATRALRGVRLVRLITSFNRGMRALGATLGRRGFGYVSLLTALVTVLGAAGMFAFEQEVAGSAMQSYGASLWWTAMLMTTMGTDYWPQTGEGRILCFLLALYAFGVFGYVTATISTFFIGRDAENAEGELAGATEIRGLAQQVNALRAEIAALNARSPERG